MATCLLVGDVGHLVKVHLSGFHTKNSCSSFVMKRYHGRYFEVMQISHPKDIFIKQCIACCSYFQGDKV